jgi:hypothetical protein
MASGHEALHESYFLPRRNLPPLIQAIALALSLLAILAGADSFVEIARFGCKKHELLGRFRPFLDGTPSHDHLGDIFAALDPTH